VPVEVGFRASDEPGVSAVSDHSPASVAVAPSTAEDGFLVLARDGQRIAFGLPADLAKDARTVEPVIAGSVADYPAILPGIDLRVIAGARGAKSFFIWHEPLEDPTVAYVVDAPGLTLVPTPEGAIELRDEKGEAVARIPRPYAVDSTPDELAGGGRFTDRVSLALAADGRTVTLAVDPAWLASAVYPVHVDPSTGWIYNAGTSSYGDAHTASAYPTTNFADYVRPDSPYYHELWNGTDPSGTSGTSYDFLRWDLSAIAGTTVDSASLALWPYHQYYNAPTSITTYARQVTRNWTEGAITWSNQPGSPDNPPINRTSAACVEGAWCYWDVATIVQNWVKSESPHPNYGFMVDTVGFDATHWKRLIASEQGIANRPRMTVTYHRPVATSTTSESVFGPDRALTWEVEPDSQTEFEVEVATNASFGSGTIVAASGETTDDIARIWEIPDSVSLTSGTTYAWRIRVNDGMSWSDWAIGTLKYDASAEVGGINADDTPNADSEDPGYDPATVSQKEAAFEAFLAAEQSGSWGTSEICPQAPGSTCGNPPPSPPSARSLDITLYYQQTRYYCVPAVIQTILHYFVGGNSYIRDGTEYGVTVWQSAIYARTITDDTYEQPGADDLKKGLPYINQRFAFHGSAWRYVPVRDTTVAAFRSRIKKEIWQFAMPLYVRVKYASPTWPGNHADPPRTHPRTGQPIEVDHATAAIGYHDAGAGVYVYNPIAKSVGGACSVPAYDTTNKFACAHDLTLDRYWQSIDPRHGEPEWY
jgi:hypothetical protein